MPPRKAARKVASSTPTHVAPGTTITIPLNDDDSEKARRNAKRQTLQEAQLNKIIAAATPRKSMGVNDGGSPMLMSTPAARGGVNAVNAQTPVKKVPILANFEEWMKMATDNKINATNSWNFALIDYFHDMSLLKEGNSINFQKASCTLDGCVKIYTSRVDSVATETGKLLSGLADNSGKKKGNQEEEGGGEGEDGDDDDEEGGRKKARKRAARSEATLAKDWSQLQLKKFDLEFAVDPLFKKAAADFDEGGAKGLLLNVLSIDEHGRIVFDSSDDVKDSTNTAESADLVNVEDGDDDAREEDAEVGEETMDHTITEASQAAEKKKKKEQPPEIPLDLDALALKFFPDIDRIEELDVCPSLKNFALGDPTASLDIPFLKALTEKEEEELAAVQENEFDAGGFDDDGDFGGGGFDVAVPGGPEATALYGQGGEAWANQTLGGELVAPGAGRGIRAVDMNGDGDFDVNDDDYIVKLGGREAEQEDILAYFDEALKKNWAGPEHWKIRKIKEGSTREAAPRTRKEKTPFTIDFVTPDQNLDDADALFATSNTSINMPKTQLRHKGRNLLPDDKHFSSRQLLRLFLKPKAMLRSKKTLKGQIQPRGAEGENNDEMVMDEQFWAQNEIAVTSTPERQQGDYDANFFHDEPLGGMDDEDDGAFADAREMFSPEGDLVAGVVPKVDENGNPVLPLLDEKKLELGYGAQLVTSSRRIRPEYVQYARVAKKVDVRKLKETMWKGMLFESIDLPPQTPGKPQPAPEKSPASTEEPKTPPPSDVPRTFTTLMNGLKTYYPRQAMNDISTSYCFISLLHLANEKGLQIEGDGSLKELYIVRDPDAEVGGEY